MSSSTELKKRKRDDEIGLPKLNIGVNYEAVADREIVDKRFERERSSGDAKAVVVSSTFDAFQRMAAGLEGRTVAEKIANPNRPTWEQYKKENEDKLDFVGGDVRKMVEYRAELDRERERLLKQRKQQQRVTVTDDSDDEEGKGDVSSEDSSRHKKKSKKQKKEKKSKKSKKKHKKESKSKKRSSGSESSSSSDEEEGGK